VEPRLDRDRLPTRIRLERGAKCAESDGSVCHSAVSFNGGVAIRMVPDRRQNDLGGARFELAGDEALRPYRRLAVRVLERALLDVTNTAGSASDRESARVFLASSPMLVLWCQIAALDPSYVVRCTQRLTTPRTRQPDASR
jgi:hypothetical protein